MIIDALRDELDAALLEMGRSEYLTLIFRPRMDERLSRSLRLDLPLSIGRGLADSDHHHRAGDVQHERRRAVDAHAGAGHTFEIEDAEQVWILLVVRLLHAGTSLGSRLHSSPSLRAQSM